MTFISEINLQAPRIKSKQSSLFNAMPLLVVLTMIAAVVYFYFSSDFPLAGAILACAILGFFAHFLCFNVKKTLAPTNWILAMDRGRLLIKFRSYLNPHFPETDPQIIQLARSEVESARMTKQTLRKPDLRGRQTTSRHIFLDLALPKADLAPLKELLRTERSITPPTVGKFFKSRSKANHYPVSVVDDRIIRIEWRSPSDHVTPGIKKAIDFLRNERIRIDPPQNETVDLTQSSADQSKAEDQILYLAERGDLIAATRLARRNLGLSLPEARRFVKELTQ